MYDRTPKGKGECEFYLTGNANMFQVFEQPKNLPVIARKTKVIIIADQKLLN